MPQPAFADGPWGEAIRYWLNERKWRQADLAKHTHIRPNTISRATRGFHTTTRVLERIAIALNCSLDTVLVSPERKLANEDRRRLARDIAEDVLLKFESRTAADAHDPYAELAARIRRLPADRRANIVGMVGDLERKPADAPARPTRPTSNKRIAKKNSAK